MPTASGILRYGPQSPSLPRKGWWLLVECDSDWFRLYGSWALQSIEPQWIQAVDRDRIFDSRRVDREPRLAISRPTILEPAWKPHISICRNERPRTHRDMWIRATEIGDLQSKSRWLQETAEALEDKARQLGPGPEARHAVNDSRGRLRQKKRVDRNLHEQLQDWLSDAHRRNIPANMAPGNEIKFEFNHEARTNGHHWWFSVDYPFLGDLRSTYGLRRRPRVPFHLTFAVLEGSDND